MGYHLWHTGGEIDRYRLEINQDSAVELNHRDTEVTEKNICRGKLRCRRLTYRVNPFLLILLISSSVLSVPLWFNFGF